VRGGGQPPIARADPAVPKVVRLEPSVGSPLAPVVRDRVREILGFDPSGVRVHTGDAAARAAASLDAAAFTVGPNVFFGARRFDPGVPSGFGLLLHELIHVRQQPAGRALHPHEATPARRASLEAEAAGGAATAPTSAHAPIVRSPTSLSSGGASLALPLAAPQDGVVAAAAAEGGTAAAAAGGPAPGPDTAALAEEVYRMLQWRLLVAHERGGVQRWR
jgi:hypothetical protein